MSLVDADRRLLKKLRLGEVMSEAGTSQKGNQKNGQTSKKFEWDLARVGLIVFSPLVCWAGYTTFQGLADIMRQGPNDYFGYVGAVIASAAILFATAASSWVLGGDLAAYVMKQRRPDGSNLSLAFIVPIFLFFFGMSVFFSYTYYHANFFGLSTKKITGEQQPMEMAGQIMTGLNATLESSYKDESKSIRESEGAVAWSAAIRELLATAGSGGNNLASRIKENDDNRRAAQEEAIRNNARAVAAAEKAKQDLEELRKRIAELKSQIDNFDSVLNPMDEQIAKFKKDAVTADNEAQKASQGLDVTGKKQCGSICISFQQKATAAREAIAQHTTASKDARNKRDAARSEMGKLQARLAPLELQANSADSLSTPGGTSVVSFGNLPAALTALESAEVRFRGNPTWTALTEAKPACDLLLSSLRQLALPMKIKPDFDCMPQDASTKSLLDVRASRVIARGEFNIQCRLDGELRKKMDLISGRVRSNAIAPAASLVEAKQSVDECIAKAGTAGISSQDLQKFYGEATDFVREHTLDRNRFELATESFSKFDIDFRKAISVAFAQDLMILVIKFLGDVTKYRSRRRRPTQIGSLVGLHDLEADDPGIRARKALLRLARPAAGDTSRITDAEIESSGLDPDVIANIRGMLNTIGRQGASWVERDGAYGIENATLALIESDLEMRAGHRPLSERPMAVDETGVEIGEQERQPRPVAAYDINLQKGPERAPQPSPPAAEARKAAPSNVRRMGIREYISSSQTSRSDRPAPPPHQPRVQPRPESRAEPIIRSPREQGDHPLGASDVGEETARGNAFEILRNRKRPS